MKAKNTYNATQLRYLSDRITSATQKRKYALQEEMGKRTKDELKKLPEMDYIERQAAIAKAVSARHPTLDKKALVSYLTNKCNFRYRDDCRNALKLFGVKPEDVDPEYANEKKRDEIETRAAAKFRVVERKLEAIKQEAMDAIYLADQTDLDAILKKLDSVTP
jgi:hypothetical protein